MDGVSKHTWSAIVHHRSAFQECKALHGETSSFYAYYESLFISGNYILMVLSTVLLQSSNMFFEEDSRTSWLIDSDFGEETKHLNLGKENYIKYPTGNINVLPNAFLIGEGKITIYRKHDL